MISKSILIAVALSVCSTTAGLQAAAHKPDTFWIYKRVGDKELKLSVFLPADYDSDRRFPVMVWFHGGSWNAGEANWHYPDCEYWSRRGMIGVSVDYRLRDRDGVKVPLECVKDAKAAIVYLRRNAAKLKVDPKRIVAAGGSAGGQLAAATAMIRGRETYDDPDEATSCIPNAIILTNPWFRCVDSLSPPKHVRSGLPPMITFIGDQDPAIPVASLRDFDTSLRAAGVSSELHVGVGGKHGFCNGRNPRNPFFYWSLELSDRFLVKHGILNGPSLVRIPAGVRHKLLVARLDAGMKQTVVTYGTSLTKVGAWSDQLATILKQNYPGQVTFINSARGGSNSDWGSRSFDEQVLSRKPDTVFIEFAVNDAVASRKTSVPHARQNLEGMIDRLLKARPNCEIILMVMNPPVGHPRQQRPDLAAYNQMYRNVAQARGLQLIDHHPVWQKILNEDPGRFLRYIPDGIHPVREGALQVIVPTLVQALGLKPGKPEVNERAPCWNYLFRMMDREVERNQQVTREEYKRFWKKHFDQHDADRDGQLNPAEYRPPTIFKHIDTNADGSISPKEYQTIHAPHFDRRDTNADGKLVAGEIWKVK